MFWIFFFFEDEHAEREALRMACPYEIPTLKDITQTLRQYAVQDRPKPPIERYIRNYGNSHKQPSGLPSKRVVGKRKAV